MVTGASSRSSPPSVSKNVPVLTATTRPRPTASAASSTFLVPPMFTASKSARFWLAPPKSAAQWIAASLPVAARRTASGSVTSPVTISTPSAARGAVSAVSRARALTASPRSLNNLQMLAPASPVAPVTRIVCVMQSRGPRGPRSRCRPGRRCRGSPEAPGRRDRACAGSGAVPWSWRTRSRARRSAPT